MALDLLPWRARYPETVLCLMSHMTFEGLPERLADVGQFVRECVGDVPGAGDVVLVALELAANAILHSRSGQLCRTFTVRVVTFSKRWLVQVNDMGSTTDPGLGNATEQNEAGRRLPLVRTLAKAWGVGGDYTAHTTWASVAFPEDEVPHFQEVVSCESGTIWRLALSIKAVVLDVTLPGDEEPARHVTTVANFAKLATERPMAEVLAGAKRVTPKRRGGGIGRNGEMRNHETVEWAGAPHKGKTSPVEAQLVRENLEAINKRLVAQGFRTIDPGFPEHARRYGFSADSEA